MNCVTCQIRTDFIFNFNSYVPPAFCRRALVILSRQALMDFFEVQARSARFSSYFEPSGVNGLL